jgi:hypothetical protein
MHNVTGVITSFCLDPHQSWLTVGTSSGFHICWDLRFQLPISTIDHPVREYRNIQYEIGLLDNEKSNTFSHCLLTWKLAHCFSLQKIIVTLPAVSVCNIDICSHFLMRGNIKFFHYKITCKKISFIYIIFNHFLFLCTTEWLICQEARFYILLGILCT